MPRAASASISFTLPVSTNSFIDGLPQLLATHNAQCPMPHVKGGVEGLRTTDVCSAFGIQHSALTDFFRLRRRDLVPFGLPAAVWLRRRVHRDHRVDVSHP